MNAGCIGPPAEATEFESFEMPRPSRLETVWITASNTGLVATILPEKWPKLDSAKWSGTESTATARGRWEPVGQTHSAHRSKPGRRIRHWRDSHTPPDTTFAHPIEARRLFSGERKTRLGADTTTLS